MNLGKDASTFKYYTMCGLQEGFEPFAVNMNREVTMWFSKRLPTFFNVPKDHHHIAVRTSCVDLLSSVSQWTNAFIPEMFLQDLTGSFVLIRIERFFV